VGEGEATITASCGGKSATCAVSVPHVNVPVTSVTLNQTSATLEVNKTLQLTATVNPDNADDKTVTWSSSDPTVASVSDTGLVKALKAGKVVITAACGGKSATCEVTVSPIGASGENLDDPIVITW
jgi:alpha-amylase